MILKRFDVRIRGKIFSILVFGRRFWKSLWLKHITYIATSLIPWRIPAQEDCLFWTETPGCENAFWWKTCLREDRNNFRAVWNENPCKNLLRFRFRMEIIEISMVKTQHVYCYIFDPVEDSSAIRLFVLRRNIYLIGNEKLMF